MMLYNGFFYLAVSLVGLVTGSFMNVLVHRVPRGISVVTPPSSCPKCSALIKWYSNIPIFSYIFQRGRCKNCGSKISIRYPIIEFVTCVIFLSVALKFGQSFITLKYCIYSYLLLAAAFTDLDTRLDKNFDCGYIPDHYTLGGTLIGYIISLTFGEIDFMSSLAGSGLGVYSLFIVGYLFKLIRKIDGIGDGDALLMGMIGSFTGVSSILFITTLSALLGSIIGIVVVRITKQSNYAFPFGPMISAGAISYIFFGSYYRSFMEF